MKFFRDFRRYLTLTFTADFPYRPRSSGTPPKSFAVAVCRMGIFQRYVFAELIRVFLMLLTALTGLLVLVGVVAKAAQNGLGPLQILEILPYIVPSILPYTIPATALLTACVVFGRMAGDQEITAIKAAGINVMAVLWPAFMLGGVLSFCTLWLTDQFVPWANDQMERVITLAMEDLFLGVLRSKNSFTDTERGISITTIRVEGKKLIHPTFRYTPSGGATVTIQAEEATMTFDMENRQVLLQLYNGHVETSGAVTAWMQHELYPFPLPRKSEKPHARNIPLEGLQREVDALERNRKSLEERQILAELFALNRGDFDELLGHSQHVYADRQKEHRSRISRLKTEFHSRLAMSCSCFFFILLGSPFSILQAKRQFLTNFFVCFLPVLLVYYPVLMLMTTLSKDRHADPAWGMWVANGLIGIVALSVLRKVLKH